MYTVYIVINLSFVRLFLDWIIGRDEIRIEITVGLLKLV
jgi:hypothetical protein